MTKINRILLVLLALTLAVNINKVFLGQYSYITGQYSDFTTFSLYLSDILLCALVFLNLGSIIQYFRAGNSQISRLFLPALMILAILLAYNLLFRTFLVNSLYLSHFLRFFAIFVLCETVFANKLNNVTRETFFKFVAILGVFESLLAIFQFGFQKSLGLQFFGEPVLSTSLAGVAKLIVNGQVYLRGYGTFPHPNLLAAFLVVACLFVLYLYCNNPGKARFWYIFSYFVGFTGLILTFSRAGWLAFGISLISFVWFSRSHLKTHLRELWSMFLTIFLAFGVNFFAFFPFFLAKATEYGESWSLRGYYNKLALGLIWTHPITGIGEGQLLLHMKQSMHLTLEPWVYQPTHNFFLLFGVENGLPAAILFIGGLILLWGRVYKQKQPTERDGLQKNLILSILLGFLPLMMLDHYFYTLNQGILLFFVVISLAVSLQKNNVSHETETK